MRWPEPAAAEAAVSGVLGVVVRVRAASTPLDPGELSAGEREAWSRLPGEGPRRRQWLLGRAALRQLLAGADTAGVAFPHRRLSLSHSGALAVAVSIDGAHPPAGAGVDLEARPGADVRTARFFLHETEHGSSAMSPSDVLRLWTVKEALYKATPANAGGGMLDYRVADPTAWSGTATGAGGRTFRYASGLLDGYRLTVAICPGGRRVAV